MARAHFRELITDQYGNALVGALVYVFEEGTVTPLTVPMYGSDAGGGSLVNPLISNAQGIVEFYLDAPRDVALRIIKTNHTQIDLDHLSVGTGGIVGFPDIQYLAIDDFPIAGTSTIPAPADHQHGGPGFGGFPTTLQPGDGSVPGINGSVAHSDHRHGLAPWALSTMLAPVQNPGAASAGVGTAFPRNDHAHEVNMFVHRTALAGTGFASVNNSTVETDIINTSLTPTAHPQMAAVGGFIRQTVVGRMTNNASIGTQTVSFRIKIGGSTKLTFVYSLPDGSSSFPWMLDILLCADNPVSNTSLFAKLTVSTEPALTITNPATVYLGNQTPIAINWTVPQTYQVTMQMGAAGFPLSCVGRSAGLMGG